MGTRSLTVIRDETSEIVVMYRQMDGYPQGHGKELAEFLNGIVLVNGISMAETRRIANGMGCLAAQIVAHFKTDHLNAQHDLNKRMKRAKSDLVYKNPTIAGSIYLHKAGTRDCGEDYVYTVYDRDGSIFIKVKDSDNTLLFLGTPPEMLAWLKAEAKKEAASDEG